jgi:hypothetical protein
MFDPREGIHSGFIQQEYGEVSGYRWDGRKWTFYGFDPNIIDQVSYAPVPTLY